MTTLLRPLRNLATTNRIAHDVKYIARALDKLNTPACACTWLMQLASYPWAINQTLPDVLDNYTYVLGPLEYGEILYSCPGETPTSCT